MKIKSRYKSFWVSVVLMLFLIVFYESKAQPSDYVLYKNIGSIPCPEGYQRVYCSKSSFGDWLRNIELKKSNTVYLYNGNVKQNQTAQLAVLNIDVGKQDLQQCADACMRLRAEFLFEGNQKEKIHFRFTNGTDAKFADWMVGMRPHVRGNIVKWTLDAKPDDSYKALQQYLIHVFRFCGTASLEKELPSVTHNDIQIGDVIIRGGFPGHAVIIVDMARSSSGKILFMIAQSYMPAQDIHILRNPLHDSSPWYELQNQDTLITPEWTFTNFTHQIHRFQ